MALENGAIENINAILSDIEANLNNIKHRRDDLGQELGYLVGREVTIRGYPDKVLNYVGVDRGTGRNCYDIAEIHNPRTLDGEKKPSLLIGCEVVAANPGYIEVSGISAQTQALPIQSVSYLFRVGNILALSDASDSAIDQAS